MYIFQIKGIHFLTILDTEIYTNVFRFSYIPLGPCMFLCFYLQFHCMLAGTLLFL